MKRLSEQTNTDKAKILHELLPDQIPAFLVFVEERAKQMLNNHEIPKEHFDETILHPKMLESIGIIRQTIEQHYEKLKADSTFFSEQLFKGYFGELMIYWLQEYMNICENDQLFRAIEFFFDV